MKRILLCLMLAAPSAFANDAQLLGPMRIQDLSPMALVRLDMLPAPVHNTHATWRFEVTTSNANFFNMSNDAKTYIESRAPRREMTAAEAQSMLAKTSGDIFYFDGEVSVTNFIITRRLNTRNEIELVLPYDGYGSGHLDTLIEGFHRNAGLNDAGRTRVPRNGVAIVSRFGDQERVFVTSDGSSGFGDATLTMRHYTSLSSRWESVLEGALRFPTGKAEQWFSSSTMNYGVQASLHRKSERSGLYMSASYVRPGDSRMSAGSLTAVPTVVTAYEHLLGARFSAVAQASWSRGEVDGISGGDLTGPRSQVSLALRRHYRSSAIWLGVTENVASFKSTPDIGVHAGVTYTR